MKYTWGYIREIHKSIYRRNTHGYIWEIHLARSVNVLSQTGWTLVYVLSQTPPSGGPLWLCAIDSTIYWDLAGGARVPQYPEEGGGTHPAVQVQSTPIYSASRACGLAVLPLLAVLSIGYLTTGRWPSGHPSMRYLERPLQLLQTASPQISNCRCCHIYVVNLFWIYILHNWNTEYTIR